MVMAPGGNLGPNSGGLMPNDQSGPDIIQGSQLYNPDNTFDIGGSSATFRPRNLYLANNLVMFGNLTNVNLISGFQCSVVILALANGPNFYGGSAAPGAGSGNNGDFFFNTTGGAGTTIYQKRSGAWVGIV